GPAYAIRTCVSGVTRLCPAHRVCPMGPLNGPLAKGDMMRTLLSIGSLLLLAACPGPADPEPPLPGTSSFDKIRAGEAAGRVDHTTALLYQLYASFDPADLPAAYLGDDSQVSIEGTATMLEIAARFAQMSPDLQARIEPFRRRPDDPQSFFYPGRGAGRL